jgi:predicted Zn-dependent protease
MTAIALDLPLEAKRALAEAVQLAPYNPYHHYAYGAVLAQERDASLSIPYFERYCLLQPHDIRGRFALAVAQFLSGRTGESQASLAELTRSSETSAGAHYFLGRIAKQQNRLGDAERELKLSLELLPTQLDVRSELGQVYMRLRRYDLAEMNLQEVLKEDPMHYFANVNLLALYQRMNHPDSAAQAERLERVKKVRSEKEQALWRTIEVRPY